MLLKNLAECCLNCSSCRTLITFRCDLGIVNVWSTTGCIRNTSTLGLEYTECAVGYEDVLIIGPLLFHNSSLMLSDAYVVTS